MNTTAHIEPDRGQALRWSLSLLVVIGLHAGAVAMLLRNGLVIELPALPPEAVLMDLPAPEPAAPPEASPPEAPPTAEPPPPVPAPAAEPPPLPVPEPPPPTEPPPPELPPPEPPPPEPPVPEPPPPVVAAPPVPMPPPPPPPEAVRPPPPKPPPPRPLVRPVTRPPPRPQPQRVEEAAPAMSAPSLPRAAATPAAPQAAAPSPPSNAVITWRGQIMARLARAKRYPEQARSRGEQGTVLALFSVDRAGRVLSASVNRSSGSVMLDEEAVAAINRADLPPMPSDMPETTITLAVPFKFDLH